MSSPKPTVSSFLEERGRAILDQFVDLLALENTVDHKEGLEANATHILKQFEQRGLRGEIWQHRDAAPLVFAERQVANAESTLVFYAHYDGQPAPESSWIQNPWSPKIYDGIPGRGGREQSLSTSVRSIDPSWRVCARSAADNKAPLVAWWSALDYLSQESVLPRVSMKFLIEGEEETGSPNLAHYLEQHARDLAGDVLLICDGPVHVSRRPQLFFGVRGFVGSEWTVYGPSRALHSGHFGNWAPNPATELSRLLASLKDNGGRVLVEGFYDDALPINDVEREALKTMPPQEETLREDLSLPDDWERGSSIPERWLEPSLNIRGVQSGAGGRTSVNCVPDTAWASVDVRLAPGQSPERSHEQLENHIRQQGFYLTRREPTSEERRTHRNILRVRRDPFSYPGYRTDMTDPHVQSMIRQVKNVVGDSLVLAPTLGGSLPLYAFRKYLDMPIVGVPIANHDNNQHGPNENIRVENLWYGVRLFSALMAGSSPNGPTSSS